MPIKASTAADPSLSINDIVAEFGGVKPYSMDSYYRGVGNPPFVPSTTSGEDGLIPASGQISFHNFYGSKKVTAFAGASATLSTGTNYKELNLRAWAVQNGWDQLSPATLTIPAGVYVWSDNTSVAALTIDGSWPGGVSLIVDGYIIGKGGRGGSLADGGTVNGVRQTTNISATSGGPGISISVNCTITVNSGGYIAGGGGGGGYAYQCGGGGGAGGGAGGDGFGAYYQTGVGWTYVTIIGGTGGALGASGSNGNSSTFYQGQVNSGGGGGRTLPGVGGISPKASDFTSSNGKGGGGGGSGALGAKIVQAASMGYPSTWATGGGGGGGGWGKSGGSGLSDMTSGGPDTNIIAGAGGSGYADGGSTTRNPSIGTNVGTYAGAQGGQAIKLNYYSCTLGGVGNVYGAVSN